MRHLVLYLLITLVVAACGGATADEGTIESTPSSPSTTQSTATTADDVSAEADDSNDSDAAAPSSEAQEDLPFENGEGFFVVDGERIDAEYVVSCIPFDASDFGGAASHPDDLAINVIKERMALQVEVGYEEKAGAGGDRNYAAVHVAPNLIRAGDEGQEGYEARFITGPDGTWYSAETDSTIQLSMGSVTGPPLDEAPMVRDGNRITGTVTLSQTWPDGAAGSVVVSYDLSFSAEQFDCSTR